MYKKKEKKKKKKKKKILTPKHERNSKIHNPFPDVPPSVVQKADRYKQYW